MLILAGCATKPQDPIVITKEVQIPFRVKCTVKSPSVPAWVVPLIKRGADVYTQMQALLADRELSIAYQKELLVALESCKS